MTPYSFCIGLRVRGRWLEPRNSFRELLQYRFSDANKDCIRRTTLFLARSAHFLSLLYA
jgi:hypothetical protein